MVIEDAIRSAIEYERKIVSVYEEAVEKSSNPTARLIFSRLADEERDHVAYLNVKLKEWHDAHALGNNDLTTIVPSKKKIDEEVAKLGQVMNKGYSDEELTMLEKARTVEWETSDFYDKLVEDLPEEGKRFFRKFQEIEDGHLYMVQAEIDCLSKNGFWMGIPEFDMEAMG
jgi:rubrerythrin